MENINKNDENYINQFLLDNDPTYKCYNKTRALKIAIENGNFKMVKFLIESNSNINANNDHSLQLASKNGN